jgi:hypothetical protein
MVRILRHFRIEQLKLLAFVLAGIPIDSAPNHLREVGQLGQESGAELPYQ